jgi:predicted O-methyltransferase YrrM
MTTRETTGLLPRSDDGAGVPRTRSWGDRLTVLAFGAIQWPWLLRSLRGGRRRDKYALLDQLGLPRRALPNLGSWKADVGLLRLVVDHVLEKRPQVMVEFGTGASTLIAARALQVAGGGRLTSFDQHGDFVEATRQWLAEYGLDADLRAAPLGPSPGGWPGLWYRHGYLPDRIDFLLIDGPPWTIHPLTRGAAESLFERIPAGGTVMLDDGARPGERLVARRWKRKWPGFDFELVKSGTKGTLVGVRRS